MIAHNCYNLETRLACLEAYININPHCNLRHPNLLHERSIRVETKMKLYNSCVQSRLLYNAGANAYKRAELDKLDAAHRRHLRRILGVFYPDHISNEDTYNCTSNTRPISIDVIEKRWTLFGHTLRLSKETTGNRVITQFYQSKAMGANEERSPTRRGRALTTLPRLLQRDLRERLTVHERRIHFNIDDLENGRHLNILLMKAEIEADGEAEWKR